MIDWTKTGHVERFITRLDDARGDAGPFFDERLEQLGRAWREEEILSRERVLVVAEGGMGKSELATCIASQNQGGLLVRLGDDCLSRSEIESRVGEVKKRWQGDGAPLIVLDALDEKVELLSLVRELYGDAGIRLVVTSRHIPQVHELIKEVKGLSAFRLARLTRAGVKAFAKAVRVPEEPFLQTVRKYDLEALCATPFGCRFLLSEFAYDRRCFSSMGLVEVWRRGIERLCEEGQTVGKTHVLNRTFSAAKLVEGAEWIATCLLSVNAGFVWSGETRDMPKDCGAVPLQDMETIDIPLALLNLVCVSGVMADVGDGRVRFAHANIRDYLMARGLSHHIPPESWDAFLNFPDGRVRTKRVGVAGWLAAMDKGYRADLLKREPELLLSNPEFLQTIGPLPVAQALLKDVDGFDARRAGREDADDYWRESLFRLSDSKVEDFIERSLRKGDFDGRQAGMALFMLEKMGASCLSKLCVFLLGSSEASAEIKLHCAQIIPRLEFDQRQLRSLLRVLRDGETLRRDEHGLVRAGLLSCLWPKVLPVNELAKYLLIDPDGGSDLFGYIEYLESRFAAQLPECLQGRNVPVLMDWALKAIVVDKSRVKRIAQFVFSLAWPKAGTDIEITKRFAKLFKLVLESSLLSLEPFANPSRYWPREQRHCLSEEDFHSNKKGRIAVLSELVRMLPDRTIDICRLGFTSTYRLFDANDTDSLIELCLQVPANGNESRALYHCLELFVHLRPWGSLAGRLGDLHLRHPKVFPATEEWKSRLDKLAQNNAASDIRAAAIRANQQKTAQQRQDALDAQVASLLYEKSWDHDQFRQLAQGVNSQDGEPRFTGANLTKSPGWGKLNELQRDVFVKGIFDYLSHYRSVLAARGSPEKATNAECALATLSAARRSLYDSLSKNVWGDVALDVLAADLLGDAGEVGGIVDDLTSKNSSAVLRALSKMDLRGIRMALLRLKGRLTEEQAVAMMSRAAQFSPDELGDVCKEIWKSGHKVVLKSFMARTWRRYKLRCAHVDFVKVYGIAFLLDPYDRLEEYLAWGPKFKSCRRALFAYIHTFVDRESLENILFECEGMDLAKLYVELHEETTQEEFDRWTFIRGLLSADGCVLQCLRNGLRKDYVDGLEYLVENDPKGFWRKQCWQEAKTKYWEWSAQILSLPDLKRVRANRQGAHYVIHSNRDFLKAVKSVIVEYEQYLQQGSCAVADLWNSHDKGKGRRKKTVMRPKCEELCSDHLARYLNLRLGQVIVNREVQVRKRYHKRSRLKGARTDIQVESVVSGARLKLIVEVKGNWNKDVAAGLQKQLIGNYLKNDSAAAGLYVVLWFENEDWDVSDGRRAAATKTWCNLKSARKALCDAVRKVSSKYIIDALAIDCGC